MYMTIYLILLVSFILVREGPGTTPFSSHPDCLPSPSLHAGSVAAATQLGAVDPPQVV